MHLRNKRIILGAVAGCAAAFYFSLIGFCDSDIEVNGVFLDVRGNMALINDAIVSEGDTVQGAKVVKISEEGVVFSRDGQEFSQRLSKTSKGKANSSVSAQNNSSLAQQTSVSSVKKPLMKTLYGMPMESFFPSNETLRQEIQQAMPANTSIVTPAVAQQMLQKANDLKVQSDAKRREMEQRIREMEGE